MMIAVFAYTERIVNMVRPRKLLFMAIGMSPTPTMHTFVRINSTYRWCCSTCKDEPTAFSTVPLIAGGARERGSAEGSSGHV